MFRSLLDHHQVYKELNTQRAKGFFGRQWDPIVFTLLYKYCKKCKIVLLRLAYTT